MHMPAEIMAAPNSAKAARHTKCSISPPVHGIFGISAAKTKNPRRTHLCSRLEECARKSQARMRGQWELPIATTLLPGKRLLKPIFGSDYDLVLIANFPAPFRSAHLHQFSCARCMPR